MDNQVRETSSKKEMKLLSRVIDHADEWWGEFEVKQLICPVCNYPFQHTCGEEIRDWEGKGDLLAILMEGECGSKWEICLGFHKGITYSFVQILRECSETEVDSKKGQVYFIEAEGLDRIKIGYSQNPEKRLAQLSTGSPVHLRILATIPGNLKLESQLHKKFETFRFNLEWFHATKVLRNYISNLK